MKFLYFIDAEGESTVSSFLTGKKLYLTGLEIEKEIELVNRIGKAGGEVVCSEYNLAIDYLVTGTVYDVNKQICMEPANIWTYLWLEDCLDQGKIASVQFFHQPIIQEPDFEACNDLVIEAIMERLDYIHKRRSLGRGREGSSRSSTF